MIKGVKICGVSDLKTLNYIVEHPYPPQFIGFITNYRKSKRYVDFEKLKELVNIDKKGINFVSVLVNPDDEILEKIKNLRFDYYQLYDVTPEITKLIKEKNKIKIISALTINNKDDVEFDEDSSASVELDYSDVDSDESVSVSSSSDDVSTSLNGSTLNIDSSSDYFGSSSITVTVSDDETSVSQTFFVTVNPVNDAPVITSTAPDGNIELGSSFEYQVGASDVDDISLFYSLSGNPAEMTISGGGLISWAVAIPIYSYLYGFEGDNYFESANIIWNAKIRYLGVGAMVVGGIWSVIQLAKPLIESIQLSLKTLRESSDNISLDSELIIIAVGIPSTNGKIDLSYIKQVLIDIFFLLT